jgi:hypothetical protein
VIDEHLRAGNTTHELLAASKFGALQLSDCMIVRPEPWRDLEICRCAILFRHAGLCWSEFYVSTDLAREGVVKPVGHMHGSISSCKQSSLVDAR